jgi:hypothetical protein
VDDLLLKIIEGGYSSQQIIDDKTQMSSLLLEPHEISFLESRIYSMEISTRLRADEAGIGSMHGLVCKRGPDTHA